MQGPHVAPNHHCSLPKLDPVVVAFARIADFAHLVDFVASASAAAASARWPGDAALPQVFGHVSCGPFYQHLLEVPVTHHSACSAKTLAAAAAAAAVVVVVVAAAAVHSALHSRSAASSDLLEAASALS